MKSLREVAFGSQSSGESTSVRALAGQASITPTIRLSALIDTLLAPVSFRAVIVTPSGTALGGFADVTLRSDGTYFFKVHMHDSGFDPYEFRVRCAVQSPDGVTLLFQTSGKTEGTGSDPLGSPNRDYDHEESGSNPLIKAYWLDVRKSSMSVSKSYSDTGLLHTIEEIAKDLAGFLVAYVSLGVSLAVVVCVSAEIANVAGATFVGPGGLVGVAVAGGVVWMFGPAAIIPALVAGVAAGAVTDALVSHRQLRDDEYRFACIVFGETLPPRERIYVTNLSTSSGRQFTWPNVDGSVLLNLGAAFDDPVHYEDNRYPVRGQVFIHELAHSWQYQTKSFVLGTICKYAFETRSYDFGSAGRPWDDFGVEQQAAIVDHWFGKYAAGWTSPEDVAARLAGADAIRDPLFRYIANNIRLGQN